MSRLTAAQLLRQLHDSFDDRGIRDDGRAAADVLQAVQLVGRLDPHAAGAALPSTFLAQNGLTRAQAQQFLSDQFAGHELLMPMPLLINPQEIETFASTAKADARAVASLTYPLPLLEDEVKAALLKIIGEPFVQPHYGGELSDIFTPRLQYQGRAVNGAFLLKGRGMKGRLRVADLGKNGDQINRLTKVAAEIFVVQHVGEIDEAVYATLRNAIAFLRTQGQPDAVGTVWDGATLARILRAYGLMADDGSLTES